MAEKTYRDGDRIVNRKGRPGVVVGDSGGMDVRVRYDDGKKDTWIQRQNLRSEPKDLDAMLDDIPREKRPQVRQIVVQIPHEGRSSGGVEIVIPLNGRNSTTIDANVHELRAWASEMLAHADRIEGAA